jgi:hypothetical protein
MVVLEDDQTVAQLVERFDERMVGRAMEMMQEVQATLHLTRRGLRREATA